MKKIIFIFIIILLLNNCATIGYPQGVGPTGLLYSNYKIGVSGGNILPGSKISKSCVYKISFLFTYGDASIEEAAQEGGIKKIYTVDKEGFGILNYGLFHRLCTVITGE